MASSSSTIPVGPPLQPSAGKGLEPLLTVPAASTEAMVDAPVAPPPVPGESYAGSSLLRPWRGRGPKGGSPSTSISSVPPPKIGPIGWTWEILDADFWDSLVDAGDGALQCILSFFSWGELTPTLEDVANHWMLPILGEHSFSNIKLSAEEEEIAAALRKRSSTRLSGWPSHFTQLKGTPVRRAAFVLYWLYVLLGTFYQLPFAAREKSAAWSRPYGDDHPGFTCASIFRKFYQPSPLIRDLKGFPSSLIVHSECRDSLGLIKGIPVGPQETTTCVADLTAFLKSRAFARWGGETTRVLIPGGHRLGFNTPSMVLPYLMPIVRSLDLLNGMESEEVGLPIPYICQRAGGALLMLWRTDLSCIEAWQGRQERGSPPSAAKESTTVPTEEPAKSTAAPSKKTKAGKEGKSTPLVPSAAKESTTVPMEEPAKSTVAPSKFKSASASPSKKSSKKSAASRPPKGQKRISISSSSPDEEEPSAVSAPSPSKKKKFVAPQFPLGAASRTRSKSGPKVTRASGRSGGGVVEVEDSDVADDDVIASPLKKGAPQTAAVDQDEELRKSVADSSEVGAESTGEDHSSSSGSFFDSAPDSVPEEEIVSAGDVMMTAPWMLMLTPSLFAVPQTVLTGRLTGPDIPIAHVMEGISLFGVTPSLRAIPAGGFVMMLQLRDAGASAVDILAGSDHLENIGMDDTVHVSEDVGEVGITGEVTAVSPPPRPTIEARHPILTPSSIFGLSMGLWCPLVISGFPMIARLICRGCLRDMVTLPKASSSALDLVDPCYPCLTAQCLFGKRLADEIKALQHQIALLQDSLAELTAYQDEMMSTGRMVPRSGRGGSFLDSLLRLTFVALMLILLL
uniref:Aminotransferase-like plant mobile domain-containing protein n=1 Tax=Fagus sylvatica TaxID=28930 RepID=A0A2N9HV39_FAGSY